MGWEMIGSFHEAVIKKATVHKNENGKDKIPIQLKNKAWICSF